MVKSLNRRQFLQRSLASMAALSAGLVNTGFELTAPFNVDKVSLGNTGLIVPRIAWGTGTVGTRRESNQTKLGMEEFLKIGRHVCDHGIKFFDMADLYGSHSYVKEVLKVVPREETILLSKIWTTNARWYQTEPVETSLDRFRIEAGTDYFDIVLLHCIVNGNWQEEKKSYIDSLLKAKQDGVVKAIGISCHNLDAIKAAAEDPVIDVIMARINPFGTHMDGATDEVMAVLETARNNGKGIIGMKIFGQGVNASDQERKESLHYAYTSPNIHSVTLGFESISQVNEVLSTVAAMV